MSTMAFIATMVAGAFGLVAVLTLIVIVLARWLDREVEDRRFQHLLKVAADFEARERLEGLYRLPSRRA